jgi:uncharacterized membrane protein
MVPASLRSTIGAFPTDLLAVVAFASVVTASLFVPVDTTSPITIAILLAYVLFLPGYVVVAALFPEDGGRAVAGDRGATRDASIDTVERVAFSFGLSLAIVPLIGLVLNYTWGLSQTPVVVTTSGFIVAGAAVAARRRMNVPAVDRFEVDVGRWLRTVRSRHLQQEQAIDSVLTVLVVVGVVLAVASAGYAMSVPTEGERYTEFYLLTEDDDDGLVAGDYPVEFERGESRPVVLRVSNGEYRPMAYTAVVELQRIGAANGSVVEQRELDRLHTGTLDHDETWTREYDVTPTTTGERLRLVFELYRGSDAPGADDPYRTLQLRVNVSD